MAINQPYKLPSSFLRKHVQEIATNIPTVLYGRIAAMVPGVWENSPPFLLGSTQWYQPPWSGPGTYTGECRITFVGKNHQPLYGIDGEPYIIRYKGEPYYGILYGINGETYIMVYNWHFIIRMVNWL